MQSSPVEQSGNSKKKGGPKATPSAGSPGMLPSFAPRTGTQNKDAFLFPLALALFALVLGVFLQSSRFGFLNFDDNQYIQEVPAVISGLNWKSVQWAWMHSHVGQWHPLTSMSFMFDSEMGGLGSSNPEIAKKSAAFFHIHNVLLQAIASVLLLFALRSLTGSVWRSAIAAAIFAIHPLRAESVAWVTERKDVLSGVFLMATLWAYAHYVKRPIQKGSYLGVCLCFLAGLGLTIAMQRGFTPHPLLFAICFLLGMGLLFAQSGVRYGIVCGLFALGLLSKPMLVTLPFVFLLLDFWPLNRVNWDKVPATGEEWRALGAQLFPLITEKLPLILMALASAVGAVIAVGEPFRPIPILPLLPRLAYVPVSCMEYLVQFFYPLNLAAHYPFVVTGPEAFIVVLSVLLLVALTLLAWFTRKRYPYFLVGWLWFLGTLLPVIGIVPGGIQIRADRYTYLTQIGLSVALIWAVYSWIRPQPEGPWKVPLPAVVVFTLGLIFTLGAAAYEQTSHWKDDKSLWTHAVAVTRNNDYGMEKLATTLQGEGNQDEAEKLYREAIRLNPRLVGSLNNLSIILRQKGARTETAAAQGQIDPASKPEVLVQSIFAEATELQQRAVQEHPKWPLMHRNLASALLQQRRPQEALASLREAMRLAPEDLDAAMQMALVLSDALGGEENLRAANEVLDRVIAKAPKAAEPLYLLGNNFFRLNNLDAAITSYQRSLGLSPANPRALHNMGSALNQKGRAPEAVELYKKAIALDPNYFDAYRNLADLLSRVGNIEESIQVLRLLIQKKGDELQPLLRLSWLLATRPEGTLRRPFEARDLAKRGIELTGGREPAFYDALGAAFARLGQFSEAADSAKKAIALVGGTSDSAAPLQQRLQLYLEGKPYEEPPATPTP
jgi:tetratricopeptide (TPR) repeat protein